jgi:hypothetical protein
METNDTAMKQAVAVRELDPTGYLPLKHDQLLPKRGILCFESPPGPEERGSQVQEQEDQRGHRSRLEVILSSDQADKVFGTHRDQSPSRRSAALARRTKRMTFFLTWKRLNRSVRWPHARLETSSEYRRFAVECDRLAQLAEMERHRKILERMAEAWRTLAEEEKSQR